MRQNKEGSKESTISRDEPLGDKGKGKIVRRRKFGLKSRIEFGMRIRQIIG